MNATTLIQLVSEQTMQNLLPILAINPARVVQISSSNPRIKATAEHVKSAAMTAGIKAEFTLTEIAKDFPAPEDVSYQFKQWLSLFGNCISNVTGGTKLMFLGAFLGANEFESFPILYCDSQNRRFVSLGKKQLPLKLSFEEGVNRITVETVLAAHGLSPDKWQKDTPNPALLAFGKRAAAIRAEVPGKLFSEFMHRLNKSFRPEKRFVSFVNPIQAESEFETRYLEAAVEADLLAREDPLHDLDRAFEDGEGSSRAIFYPLRQNQRDNARLHKMLSGLWLELYVLDLLRKTSRFADPQWSVQPVSNENQFGETDLVCFDREKVSLTTISCKSSMPALEHFEALRQRAEFFGGSHAQAILCVSNADPDRMGEARRWERSQRIRLLAGDLEIRSFFA